MIACALTSENAKPWSASADSQITTIATTVDAVCLPV